MTAAVEQWRPVPGYEGRYEVSDHGHVRSLGFSMANRFGTRSWKPGRVLKAGPTTSGHRAVTLVDENGAHKIHKVHRLVLRAFKGEPPPGKPDGLHKDDDPANNWIDNLRWGNQSENTYDNVENGNHVQARKSRCALDHLLVAPNLVECTAEQGNRSCLACKLSQANHLHDARLREQGRERTRYNRGRDGFQRRWGEAWQEEANRRYAHIMRDYEGGL